MSEPWIRVHANIASRPVIGRASAALHVSENEAVGLMVRFWGGASQHTVNGDISTVPDATIEGWAGWKRKRGTFAAFVRSSHIDPDGRVREWDDYAGPLETRRAKDRDRKAMERSRKSTGSHADVPQTSALTRAKRNDNDNETIRETPVVVGENGKVGERGERGEIVGVIIGQPAEYALQVTIAANHAVAAKWGEQLHPYLHGNAFELAQALQEAGVPLDVARESIASQVTKSGRALPPGSINWFRPGVLTYYAEQQQKVIQSANPAEPQDVFGLHKWAKEHA